MRPTTKHPPLGHPLWGPPVGGACASKWPVADSWHHFCCCCCCCAALRISVAPKKRPSASVRFRTPFQVHSLFGLVGFSLSFISLLASFTQLEPLSTTTTSSCTLLRAAKEVIIIDNSDSCQWLSMDSER